LRSGEKLEETLWEPDAHREATAHPKIWRVHEPQVCAGAELAAVLQRLEHAVRRGDPLSIEAELARAIPTYAPATVPA
jgi:FlaA1/EpsC-like NDP-sugar epimerase